MRSRMAEAIARASSSVAGRRGLNGPSVGSLVTLPA
jgi:hypothetical protein